MQMYVKQRCNTGTCCTFRVFHSYNTSEGDRTFSDGYIMMDKRIKIKWNIMI